MLHNTDRTHAGMPDNWNQKDILCVCERPISEGFFSREEEHDGLSEAFASRYRSKSERALPEMNRLVDGSAAGGAAAGVGGEKAEMEKNRRNPALAAAIGLALCSLLGPC